jgi:coatomer subunit beta'
MYLLGYLASQSRVYLMDKDFNVVPYTLLLSVVEYKTLVLRGELDTAAEVLETIPQVGGGWGVGWVGDGLRN